MLTSIFIFRMRLFSECSAAHYVAYICHALLWGIGSYGERSNRRGVPGTGELIICPYEVCNTFEWSG